VKIEGYLFVALGVFLVIVTAVYWVLSGEVVGTTCLLLSGLLALMIAYYLLFTARRMEARPEDRPDAEVAEGSGEVGFFPPHSWWPIALAASFTVTTVGLVIGPFLVLIGTVLLFICIFGLLFEFYVGMNRSQGHTLGELQAMGEKPTSLRKFLGE
jgi:hypothetical protein